ncbi:MAG TPA: hypothetical protein VHO70_07475 [Chitinispirillaceae bacterium]|nr:hypothetical protein [Chitinispirillaceae bacterium]
MISKIILPFLIEAFMIFFATAEPLTTEQKDKVTAKLEESELLGTDAIVIAEVKALPADLPLQGMTNEKWQAVTIIGPEVKNLSKNTLTTYLKTKKDDAISEIFVSDSTGNKIAFFQKPPVSVIKANQNTIFQWWEKSGSVKLKLIIYRNTSYSDITSCF